MWDVVICFIYVVFMVTVAWFRAMSHRHADMQNPGDDSALVRALKAGHHNDAQIILTDGCPSLLHRSREGKSVWFYGVDSGNGLTVLLMIWAGWNQKGWDINVAIDEEGSTALHLACHKGNQWMVSLLMSHGADPNNRDSRGQTPVLVAATWGKWEVFEMFLKFDNVDFGVVDYSGLTIIHQLFLGGQASLARELLQPQYGIDPEQKDVFDMTLMDIAIRLFHAELLAILLRLNCKLPDTVEIFGDRNPWARLDITSSEDPISMPTFEFVFGAGAIEVAGMLYEAGMQLGVRYCPVEDKFHSRTFGRLVRYPVIERRGEGSSEWVKAATLTPKSLKIQCRAVIRGRLGRKLHAACDSLQVPAVLTEYLLIG